MAFDDAYQEAYVKFLEIKLKYEGTVDSPSWFMALYKTALGNRITDFANQANRLRRQVCFTELQGTMSTEAEALPYEELLVGELGNSGQLAVLLEEAPDAVRQVLSLLTSKDSALLGILSESWKANKKRKENGNEYLCRLLGYDHTQVDLVESTRKYLEEI